jgi:hypothetical protein
VVRIGIGRDQLAVTDDIRDEIGMHTHAHSDRGPNRRCCFRPIESEDDGKGIRTVGRWATDEVPVRVQLVIGVLGLRILLVERIPVPPGVSPHADSIAAKHQSLRRPAHRTRWPIDSVSV